MNKEQKAYQDGFNEGLRWSAKQVCEYCGSGSKPERQYGKIVHRDPPYYNTVQCKAATIHGRLAV